MFTHKILTDVRADDNLVEVAIDATGSPLGRFTHQGYVQFNERGGIIVPFSGDRRVVVDEHGVKVLDADDTVLAHFPHED